MKRWSSDPEVVIETPGWLVYGMTWRANFSCGPCCPYSFPVTAEPMAGCESSLEWCLLFFLPYVWVYATFNNCLSAGSYNPPNKNLLKGVRSCEVILNLPWLPVHLPGLNCWSLKSLFQRSHWGATANLFFHLNVTIFFRQWNIQMFSVT